jgi:ubiquinone/menaquinone biosynthesis C-methylase UbiE
MAKLEGTGIKRRRFSAVILSLLLTLSLAHSISVCRAQSTYQEETDRLAALLSWQPSSTMAEIGAGHGQMTLAAAKRVGKIYSTELEGKLLTNLEQLAATKKNIVAVKAAETDTNLPEACCDSILMRLVYHHLTKPAEMDAGLFRSVKPGGLPAVIDEERPPGSSPPEGVPKNRGGHGRPKKLLILELTTAGFQVVQVVDNWPNHKYCVLFKRPPKQ